MQKTMSLLRAVINMMLKMKIRMSSAILKAPVHPAVMKAEVMLTLIQKQTDSSVKQTKI